MKVWLITVQRPDYWTTTEVRDGRRAAALMQAAAVLGLTVTLTSTEVEG